MSLNQHTHHLSNEQLICDNDQCREKVLDKIKEIKNDFDIIVDKNSNDNKITNNQAWNIINLTSQKLSDRLILLFNKQQIEPIIQKFIEENNTKQAFEKAFDYEKNRKSEEFITKEQLWNIYIQICEDALQIISKTKKER
jgi:hypothetical protein